MRWLRPEFQDPAARLQSATPSASQAATQADIAMPEQGDDSAAADTPAAGTAPAARQPWPSGLPEQIKAVAAVLTGAGRPLALAELEARFNARGRWRERLPTILETLQAVGRAQQQGGGRWQAV